MNQIVFILGRHPKISIAELTAVFPQSKIITSTDTFVVFENLDLSAINLARLGGTVKFGEVFSVESDFASQKVYEYLAERLASGAGKQIFGISSFGARFGTLKTLLIGAKKFLRAQKISTRFINKNFQNLSSAQTEFEIIKRNGNEILVAFDGLRWFFAETKAVQPFASYQFRDYKKPARDARVGMLPPKLAQILINLAAAGDLSKIIYDPFCGTGTVLVEAALMGHEVVGSDIDARICDFARKNLNAFNISANIFTHDAVRKASCKFDVVVTEGTLGPPRREIPSLAARRRIFAEIAEIYEKFFSWVFIHKVVITLPVYLEEGVPKFFASDIILPRIKQLGWRTCGSQKLLYFRPNQIVGREIVIFEK